MRARVHLGALVAFLVAGGLAHAQEKWVTGYYQNVPLWSQETDLSKGGLSDFNRIRLTTEPVFGKFSIEAAYEQVATFRQNQTDGIFVGLVPSGGEWLDLQWTIVDKEHVLWQHRFDRLKVSWQLNRKLELSAGRQALSPSCTWQNYFRCWFTGGVGRLATAASELAYTNRRLRGTSGKSQQATRRAREDE